MCVFQHDRRLPTQTVNGSISCFPCASKNTSHCLSAGPSPPAWAPYPHGEHLPRHSWGKTCLIHGTPGRQIDLPKLTTVCGRGRSLFLQSLCRSPLWTLPGHGPGPGWGEPKGHTTGALLAFLHKAGDRHYPQHPRDHHAQDGGGRRSGRDGAASLGANGRSRTVGRGRHLAVRGGTARLRAPTRAAAGGRPVTAGGSPPGRGTRSPSPGRGAPPEPRLLGHRRQNALRGRQGPGSGRRSGCRRESSGNSGAEGSRAVGRWWSDKQCPRFTHNCSGFPAGKVWDALPTQPPTPTELKGSPLSSPRRDDPPSSQGAQPAPCTLASTEETVPTRPFPLREMVSVRTTGQASL